MAENLQVTTPEERTKERSAILEQQRGLAGADLGEQKRLQRQDTIRQIAQQSIQAVRSGSPVALNQVSSQAQAAGQMQPIAEQAQAGQLALQTEAMRGETGLAQQEQRAKQAQFAGQESVDRLALEAARRAFDLGYNAKQLALHSDAKVADLAFQQMYDDFQAGRLTQKEVENYQRNLRDETMRIKRDAEAALKDAMMEFKTFTKERDAREAKKRLLTALNRYKEALKSAARASNAASILSGVFTIGGAVVGGIAGGPGGAVVGGKVGGAVADAGSAATQV